ncbi:MAG: tetratricopeptide repeat protein [Bacteroidaceae bacterium]|jgi:tetratricopeptide (TPR) repeat protein
MATTKKEMEEQATSKFSLTTWIEKNGKIVGGIVIALIIIIGGYFAYKHLYLAPREEKAEAAIFKGETYFGIGAYNEALNGDNRGYIGFLRIIKEYSGTSTANLAKGYAGICYAQLKKYQDAIEYLNDFDADDAIVAPMATAAKGDCYVELGNLDKACEAFLEAAAMADSKAKSTEGVNNTISPLFLMKAGIVYEKQKEYGKALEVYNKIKETYSNSYQTQSGEIDKYIERATALGGQK